VKLVTMILLSRLRWLAVVAVAVVASVAPPSGAKDETGQPGCVPKRDDYFHPKAVRLHQSGTVLVEYSVNSKGLTERVVVLQSTASESLEESALLLLSKMRCKPSKEWISSGGPQERLRLNVLFQFFDEEPAKPIDPEAEVITITTSSLRDADNHTRSRS